MSRSTFRCLLAFLLLLMTINAGIAQSPVAALREANNSALPAALLPPNSVGPAEAGTILARFVTAETKVREALNQHTFKRDVVLQTIGPNGEVTGEYVRNSQFIFDDRGRRIERVLYHPSSTIREMRITKEDILDLEGSQLLGIDIVEATKYQLTYAGAEMIEGRQLFAVEIAPLIQPDPRHMRERFFVGRVWIDPASYQIVKIKGVVEPQGKQRFPLFVTWREPVKDSLAFPTRTEADDILHFRERDVHYRIKVRYYDYKEFASKVIIKDIDDGPKLEDATPTAKELTTKPGIPSKVGAAPNASSLFSGTRAGTAQVCTLNRTAPPVGAYHWPADAAVKVYFIRNMFSAEQRVRLLEAMHTWNQAGNNASGVTFTYAGDSDSRMNCRSCLTVSRRDVFARDKHHYAFFHPMIQEEGRLLVAAWIDLDVGIIEPEALQGFMAHELAHGLGLWDCPSCKKKQSLMNSFPGLNKNNGLVAPSSCDLATMKDIYQEERQIASLNNNRETITNPALAIQTTGLAGTGVSVNPSQPAAGGAAAEKPLNEKQSQFVPAAHTFTSPLDFQRSHLTRSLLSWGQLF
ncbi:MAG TPA: hypothetical protein VK208_20160 [Pyrinomonadaceae bacterium]|nr:hypothetical protein [Pyrinomonadaceae bacterium]